MECLKCESSSVLDRVAVDRVTERPIGALCDSCQHPEVAHTFDSDVWHEDSGCAVCADRAHYCLPKIDCRIQFDDDRADSIEYTVEDTTVRLCSDHFEDLLKGEAAEPAAAAGAVPQ